LLAKDQLQKPYAIEWDDKEVTMFKHILLPTDGSELSEAAIQKGRQFAKSLNAKVTGFQVSLPFHSLHSSDGDARGYAGAV